MRTQTQTRKRQLESDYCNENPPQTGSKRLKPDPSSKDSQSKKEVPDPLRALFPYTKGATDAASECDSSEKICTPFFEKVPTLLGNHWKLLISPDIGAKLSKMQMLLLLVDRQRKRIGLCLQNPELLDLFYDKKDQLNPDFFVATETWIADFNLLLFCIEVKQVRGFAIKTIQNLGADFAIRSTVEEMRNTLKGDKRQTLQLNNIGLTDIPPEICLFPSITKLNLSGNHLWCPHNLNSSHELCVLDLSNNSIEENWKLTHTLKIKALSLDNNGLTKIPKAVHQLPELNTLSLCDNKLFSLSSIRKLIGLKSLNLSGNIIEELPTEINNLTNLLVLDISRNCLKTVPDLANLCSLRTLNICDNDIRDFPETISKLHRLQFLDISNNPITSIPVELFQLPKLQTLTISENQRELLPAREMRKHLNIKIANEAQDRLSQSIGEVTDNYDSDLNSSFGAYSNQNESSSFEEVDDPKLFSSESSIDFNFS